MKVQLNTLKAVAYRGVPVPAYYLAKMRGATVLPPRYYGHIREMSGPKYSAPCLNITASHGTLKPTREQCG